MDAVRLSAAIFASESVRAVTSNAFPSSLNPNVKKLGIPNWRNTVLHRWRE